MAGLELAADTATSVTVGSLASVNVGKPKDVDWQGRAVHTGVWKTPRSGPLRMGRLNLDGDGQGDLVGHGGPHRAVLVYQTDAYAHWAEHFGWTGYGHGLFGENLTVRGLGDDQVFVGDRYRIGTALFEVSQPRVTCFRVGMRVGEPRLAALMVAHGRPGFYMRVLEEGDLEAGQDIIRVSRGRDPIPIAEVDALLYLPNRDPDQLAAIVDNPALSPGWQQSFRELLEPAAQEPAEEWAGFRAFEVSGLVRETSNVTSIYLAPADGERLPSYGAGQYLTVKVPASGEPGGVVRSYSLSTSPRSHRYRISVKQEPHGVASTFLNRTLRSGDQLAIAAPRGSFVIGDDTRPVVLASAGIGVTPVLAMLHALAEIPVTRRVLWLHAARTVAEHAFRDEALRLLDQLPSAEAHVFYSAGSDRHRGARSGRMTAAALVDIDIPADADVFICGPTAFMTDMQAVFADRGIPADRIHVELFGALGAINPGVVAGPAHLPHPPAAVPMAEGDPGHQVTFSRSRLRVEWAPGHGTLLELAEACDVPTRWACRTGVCHTCITPVVTGDVEYVVAPLEPPPDGSALICCSRPGTDVVLEL